MKVKTQKILVAIATILLVLTMLTGVVKAAALTPNSIKANTTTVDSEGVSSMAGRVLGALQIIGVALAVIILAILGIKYMLGSVEEKSEYKKTLIPYLIGAVLVFSGTTIPNIIYLIARSI